MQRNIELVWLTGQLMPDFKTIADFRKDNGEAIRKVCREFVRLELLSKASVAIDGSKFKAVNTRDRNFTQAKMQRRLAQIDESMARYLSQLDSADRQGEAVPEAKIARLNEKIATLRQEIQRLNALTVQMMQTEDKQISLTDPAARSMATSGRGSGRCSFGKSREAETLAVLCKVFWPPQREQAPNLRNAKVGRKLAHQGRRFPGLVRTAPKGETSGGKAQSNNDSRAFLDCPFRPNSCFYVITGEKVTARRPKLR